MWFANNLRADSGPFGLLVAGALLSACSICPTTLVPGLEAVRVVHLGTGVSVGTAVIHDLGHAHAYFEFGMDPWDDTNSDALYYENHHRDQLMFPRHTRREKH